MIPPALFFFLNINIALAILGLLCLHTNFYIFCSSSVKNASFNLIETALHLYIALGCTVILTILIFLSEDNGISFYLFFSSISFISVLQFSDCRSLVSLGLFSKEDIQMGKTPMQRCSYQKLLEIQIKTTARYPLT